MSSEIISNLVERAKNEDKTAFAQLYEFYKDDMYRFAYYTLSSKEMAEDCVSDAVLLAFQKLPQLKKNNAFKSWLFKILHNCCNKALKEKIQSRNNIEFSPALNISVQGEDLNEKISLISALDSLDETDREVIVLYFACGYNSKEIGELLSLNDSTVRSKIKRSTEKMREKLSL